MPEPANADPLREHEPKLDMASLIDVSFLLLIFFMVSATLQKQEADLGLILPGITDLGGESVTVDQMTIKVDSSGSVLVNDEVVDSNVNRRRIPKLNDRLKRYRAVADLAGSEPMVIIDCSGEVPQQRFIDVLNACAKVGIKHVSLTR